MSSYADPRELLPNGWFDLIELMLEREGSGFVSPSDRLLSAVGGHRDLAIAMLCMVSNNEDDVIAWMHSEVPKVSGRPVDFIARREDRLLLRKSMMTFHI